MEIGIVLVYADEAFGGGVIFADRQGSGVFAKKY